MASTPTETPERPALRALALVGYRGTGKSTVGRLLAARLGFEFIDADVALERRLGKPIARVFAEDGEPAFRDAEAALLGDLTTRTGCVLATGGGAILRPANRQALRRFGLVVWLTAEPEVLARRLEANPGGRPALTDQGLLAEIASVLEVRLPLYAEVADLAVASVGRTPSQVAEAVLELVARRHTLPDHPTAEAGA